MVFCPNMIHRVVVKGVMRILSFLKEDENVDKNKLA